MYEVFCPECRRTRTVKTRKPWMEGEPPFQRPCKSCCQIGKEVSPETRAKLSEIAKQSQTEELRAHKSDVQKERYEAGVSNLIPGAGGGWNKDVLMGPRTEETKKRISDSMTEHQRTKRGGSR